jgi:hypothetical protein
VSAKEHFNHKPGFLFTHIKINNLKNIYMKKKYLSDYLSSLFIFIFMKLYMAMYTTFSSPKGKETYADVLSIAHLVSDFIGPGINRSC